MSQDPKWSDNDGTSSRLDTGNVKSYENHDSKGASVADNKYTWNDKDGGEVHDHKYVERDYEKGVVREGGKGRIEREGNDSGSGK